jgi:hypothetical membrane protein
MTTAVNAESCGEVMSRAWRGRTATRALLVAGIVASGVYVVGDLLSGLLYKGYSFTDQAISELSAYGSPVRSLMVAFLTVHGLLLVAFSVGLRRSGDRIRALRWVGIFLLAAIVVGLFLHPFFPMSSRAMEQGFNDTMHIVLTGVWGFLVFPAVVFAAVAYRGWFRLYSIGSLLVMVVFGWLAATAMQGIAEKLPTPWVGAFERINAYVYLAWLVVLAVTVMRRSLSDVTPEMGGTGVEAQRREPAIVASG